MLISQYDTKDQCLRHKVFIECGPEVVDKSPMASQWCRLCSKDIDYFIRGEIKATT